MEFYREGFLNKAGKGIIQTHLHSWRPRYFILDGLQLKYYKSKELLQENMLGCIEVSEMESVSIMKNETKAFQITTKAPRPRTYYMSGRNEDEVQGWIKCLNMARQKFSERMEKEMKNSGDKPVPSVYDELNFTTERSPPAKPPRSLIVSGSSFLDSSPAYATPITPASSTSKTTTDEQPVLSQYAFVDIPSLDSQATEKTQQNKGESLYQDPTYDTINEKAVKKKSNNEDIKEATDLYDTVSPVTTKKLTSRASDPLPHPVVPPPLPARLPSMSSDSMEEEIKPEENENPQMNPIGLYDEVKEVDGSIKTKLEAKEVKSEPLHLYAKPQKKMMKKKLSKKKIIPGLMDVGEVDDDIEEEAAGGRETLNQGMTKPYGDQFAIEDLREFLAECDEEDNNNDSDKCEEILVDFDLNPSASAFDLLKSFLLKYD